MMQEVLEGEGKQLGEGAALRAGQGRGRAYQLQTARLAQTRQQQAQTRTSHLSEVHDHVLRQGQSASVRHRNELEGVAGKCRSIPNLRVALVHHIDRQRSQSHGVLGVTVAGWPCWSYLVQYEQHRLVVLMQEHNVFHLHIPT